MTPYKNEFQIKPISVPFRKGPWKYTQFMFRLHLCLVTEYFRALYIVNWYYRYTQEGFSDKIAIVAGCVQTVLYLDFFYLYITKGM